MGGTTQHLDGVLSRHDEQDQLQGQSICLRRKRQAAGFHTGTARVGSVEGRRSSFPVSGSRASKFNDITHIAFTNRLKTFLFDTDGAYCEFGRYK